MAQRVLATFNIESGGSLDTEIRVVAFEDDKGSVTGAAKIETSWRYGTVASWTWLGESAADFAMRAAVASAGWGILLSQGEFPPPNDYRKVSII